MGVLADMGVTAQRIHETAVFLVLFRYVLKHYIVLDKTCVHEYLCGFVARCELGGDSSSSTFGSHVLIYVLCYSATACVALKLTEFHFILDKP